MLTILFIFFAEETQESSETENNETSISRPAFVMKKSKSKPDMAIRRKQLKAKSKAISDQIKKRKQIKKTVKPKRK